MPCHGFLQMTGISQSDAQARPHNTTAHGAWDKILVASVPVRSVRLPPPRKASADRRGPQRGSRVGVACRSLGEGGQPDRQRPPEESLNKSRSTPRPPRPQRRNASGFLRVLCELCVQTSYFFTGSEGGP